jgi:hypothetical protein
MTDAAKAESVSSSAQTSNETASAAPSSDSTITAAPSEPAGTALPADRAPAPEIAVGPGDAVAPGAVQAAASLGKGRYALLAGGLGFAAGVGLLAGGIGIMGAGHLFASPTKAPAPWAGIANETRALKQSLSKLEAQVASLKTSIEASNRQASTQRSQVTARYEQSAKTQNETQTQLGKISDAVERLEKRVAAIVASEATGSIAPKHVAAPPPHAIQPPPEKPAVAQDWSIRSVFRGRALVSSPRGVFEAAPGLHLPGLGRVEAVTRENGRWVVITEKGIITAMRRPRYEPDFMPN